ncbi:MAG: CBS domain-containing protein [Myxococcales bacterium]|nr:MAG: CBS domain-containing protein [Myxococcales bacterium]
MPAEVWVVPERILHLRGAMGTTTQLSRDITQVLQELRGARDEARLRVHLLGMDAKRRLSDLETEIEAFERKLTSRGDWAAEHVVATARGLTRAVAELVAQRPEREPTRVVDLMKKDPITCQPHDDLSEAAKLMFEGDFGVVPVVDEQGKPIGMLTDRDVCMAAYTRGVSLRELTVESAMSRSVASCRPSDTLRLLMDAMATYQVRRMPVVDEAGKLVGIVSLADVARLAQTPTLLSHEARVWVPGVLAGISEPSPNYGPAPTRAAS